MRRDPLTLRVVPKDREPNFTQFAFEFVAYGLPAIGLFVLLMIGLALGILAFSKPAHAHSWYPAECCHDLDCYPIAASEVEALPDGTWKVKATGEIFTRPHSGSRAVKFSPDGGYHRCSIGADRKASSFCLFIPLPAGS